LPDFKASEREDNHGSEDRDLELIFLAPENGSVRVPLILNNAIGMGDLMTKPQDSGAKHTTRRSFVAGAMAFGATALLPALRAATQTGTNSPRRIDVHHHFVPDAYLAFQRAHNQGGANNPWTLSKDLEDMEKGGASTALMSVTAPGFWFGQVEEVRKVSRECNEAAAKLSADHPGRFGSFATIPMADTEGALREMEYALDTLKADGLALFTNYADNKFLGDPSFDAIWQEANRRKVVVYVHPIEAACCRGLVKDIPNTLIEYGADTGRTIGSLIFSGASSKYPDIKFIFSHGGGVVPFLIERFLLGTAAEVVPGIVTKGAGGTGVVGSNFPQKVPKGPLYELRKLYYDTAQATNPVAMGALRKVVPISQIVFGTDYWFRTVEETARSLTASKVFNDAELRAINRGNAERILQKYKS
jgi:predicted TIM-barrel fold metal-dependent hydrolase